MPDEKDPNREPQEPKPPEKSEKERLIEETELARIRIEHDEVFKLRDLPKALNAQQLSQDARQAEQDNREVELKARKQEQKQTEKAFGARASQVRADLNKEIASTNALYDANKEVASRLARVLFHLSGIARLSEWTDSPNTADKVKIEEDVDYIIRILPILKTEGK